VKRLLVLIVVLAMVGGCCANTAPDGTVTKSFSNCLTTGPLGFICSPTPAQQATAAAMLIALDAAQAAGAIFYPPLGIAQASAVLNTIKAGGCFLVAQLAEAFKVVDAANAATAKAQAKMLKMAPVTLPEYAPLRVFVK
jgi:hypothetical protein